MKTRTFLFLTALAGLACTAVAIDFGNLTKAADVLNKANKVKEGVDTFNDINKFVSSIGPEEERDLGQTVAIEIIGRFGGLVRDEEIGRRVNLIGHALALYSNRPDRAWKFGVLNSDTVNAFSAPDGYVFITRGLYKMASDDDRLAAILGHEISHITNRDALRIIATSEKGAILLKHVSKRSGDVRQGEAYLNQLGLNAEKIVKFLIEKGYDHPTEFSADKNGHDLAATTGYAPGGLRAVLQDLQAKGGDQKKLFPTHPPLKERIKRLPDEPAPGA